MKLRPIALLFIVLSCSKLFAQDFTGYVKHRDSLSTAIFQAKITILNGGERKVIKTYFNGSFSFHIQKNQAYTVFVAYPGYVDTFFTVTTDKETHPTPSGITIKLKKDGMRLMGIIRSSDQKFPIDSATIVLKNILNRKETRQTTDIDGAYNLKLEYETNYSIKIDKMSPGIIDKYADTTMYISTIGFNQPLDYKLDIYLDPFGGTIEHQPPGQGDGSNAIASSSEQNLLVTDDNTIKAEQQAFAMQLHDSLARKAYNDSLSKAALLVNQKRLEDSLAKVSADQKKMADELNAGKIYADSLAKALVAARKQIALDSVERANAEKLRKSKESAAQKAAEDSIARASINARKKAVQDSIKGTLANNQKVKKDTTRSLASEDSITKILVAARKQIALDSVERANAEKLRKSKELAAQKAMADSIARASINAHKKAVQDSVKGALANNQKVKKDTTRSLAPEDSIVKARLAVSKKLSDDSIKHAVEEADIAKELAGQKKFEDSITKIQAEARRKIAQDSIPKTTAAGKTHEDSLAKTIALLRKKLTDDSTIAAIQSTKHKAYEDSLMIINAGQQKLSRGLVAKKALLDSIQNVRVEQQRLIKELTAKKLSTDSIPAQAKIARELTEKKTLEDSLNKAWNEGYKKMVQDSISLAILWREKLAKEQAVKRTYVDSIVGTLAVLRQKRQLDSIIEIKAAGERFAKQKASKDSIARVYEEAGTQKRNTDVDAVHAGNNIHTGSSGVPRPDSPAIKIGDTPTRTMPFIAFGKNSFAINQLAANELKSIINLLANPALQLRIYALSSADENGQRLLSLKRADAIIRFMVQEGIPAERVKSRYLGSDISLSGCKGATCPEESLMKNRCAAYAIVKP